MAPHAKRSKKGKDKPRIRPGSVKPVKEATFDDEARRDFLTGFSKRKQQRKLAGRQKAEAKEKEELLRLRREFKQQQRDQAAENVRLARAAFGDDGAAEADDEPIQDEQEYADEQFETTVTVEEFDVNAPLDALPRRPRDKPGRPPKQKKSVHFPRRPASTVRRP